MALTVGSYAWPGQPRLAATVTLVLTVALGTGGVQRGARVTRVLVAVVLTVLALVVVAGAGATRPPGEDLSEVNWAVGTPSEGRVVCCPPPD
jgi:APA family basic amino acid/polyamine antiporter